MQDHPIAGMPADSAPLGSEANELQRRVLLELVTHPPARGDRIDDLVRTLDAPRQRIQAAADALANSGLARRDGTAVYASEAALRFETLWPTV